MARVERVESGLRRPDLSASASVVPPEPAELVVARLKVDSGERPKLLGRIQGDARYLEHRLTRLARLKLLPQDQPDAGLRHLHRGCDRAAQNAAAFELTGHGEHRHASIVCRRFAAQTQLRPLTPGDQVLVLPGTSVSYAVVRPSRLVRVLYRQFSHCGVVAPVGEEKTGQADGAFVARELGPLSARVERHGEGLLFYRYVTSPRVDAVSDHRRGIGVTAVRDPSLQPKEEPRVAFGLVAAGIPAPECGWVDVSGEQDVAVGLDPVTLPRARNAHAVGHGVRPGLAVHRATEPLLGQLRNHLRDRLRALYTSPVVRKRSVVACERDIYARVFKPDRTLANKRVQRYGEGVVFQFEGDVSGVVGEQMARRHMDNVQAELAFYSRRERNDAVRCLGARWRADPADAGVVCRQPHLPTRCRAARIQQDPYRRRYRLRTRVDFHLAHAGGVRHIQPHAQRAPVIQVAALYVGKLRGQLPKGDSHAPVSELLRDNLRVLPARIEPIIDRMPPQAEGVVLRGKDLNSALRPSLLEVRKPDLVRNGVLERDHNASYLARLFESNLVRRSVG